jgi:hypothetical protein
MSSSGVSEDLPPYLKSQFTKSNPAGPTRRPLKLIKPALRQGVSSESPVFFHLNHISILDPSQRNLEISSTESDQSRFLSSLKQNNISLKPKFSYTDSQLCQFDYHNLKPSSIIDLSADKSPKLKDQTRFRQEFQTHLSQGFGKSRGQCTVEAMQPKVPRYLQGQIDILKQKLSLSQKHEGRYRMKTGKNIMNSTIAGIPCLTPALKKKQMERRTSTPSTIDELDQFERNQLSLYSNLQTRRIYEF